MFEEIRKQYRSYREKQEEVKRRSNNALNKSKQAIFALHRDDFQSAEELLKQAEDDLKKVEKLAKKEKNLCFEGSYKAALEEFIEAKFFWQVLQEGKIDFIKGLEISFSDYLAGICDLTGEILRKVIQLATKGDYEKVYQLKKIVEDIIAELVQLDLTGYLRTKYDAAKRNLKKLEEILYDIKIKR